MKTTVNLDNVKAIAEGYLLPEPYQTSIHNKKLLLFCYDYVLTFFEKNTQVDKDELWGVIDEYFNCD